MRILKMFFVAIIFFMAEAAFADIIVTQEVVNVRSYAKGSTTIKLKGSLNKEAIDWLAQTNRVAICSVFDIFLSSPLSLSEGKKGFETKKDGKQISLSTKNGKFKWAEKDATENFVFAIGNERVKPTKASFKSSGTLEAKDFEDFGSKKVAVLDFLSNEKGLLYVSALAFLPEISGKKYKCSDKTQDLRMKFSASSKGKASASFKLSSSLASPAVISETVNSFKPYLVIDLSGGTGAENYPVTYLDEVPEGGWTDEYKTTKMVLRFVQPGKFKMGSPEDELGGYFDEVQHEVTLSKPFYAGVFEVTQKQYELVTGEDPSDYKGDARPVECVSYDMLRGTAKGSRWPSENDVDEDSFFGILRAKTNLDFDLPSEAQWEYACRAGTTTALNDGHDLTPESLESTDENLDKLGRYAYNFDDGHGGSYDAHTTVGSYQPNAWGLYDMHGNVLEWCLDWWDFDEEWSTFPAKDPKGADINGADIINMRCLRGGDWCCNPRDCRSAFRFYTPPDEANSEYGFRVFLIQ